MTVAGRRTPLAWLNLTHDGRRLLTSLAGVGFAVVLIFTELGFLNALLQSTVAPLARIQQSPHSLLVIVHRERETLADTRRFAGRWLVEAESCAEVAWARPVFLDTVAEWHNPRTGQTQMIRVLASDSEDLLALLAATKGPVSRLRRFGTALFDIRSKRGFGFDELTRAAQGGARLSALLSGNRIDVVGTFSLGTDFVNDGNLIVGLPTFNAIVPERQVFDADRPAVDLGVIRVADGADPLAVRTKLERLLVERSGTRVLTLDELIAEEQAFWQKHTPIGPIFLLGVVLGFVVGVLICYQVLSSDIRDHFAEYATLKAIGYGNGYLVRVVFRQALWLGMFGFTPAVLTAVVLYALLGFLTGLPMRLSAETVLFVLLLTLIMCVSSAYLAVRRLFSADPAELFR